VFRPQKNPYRPATADDRFKSPARRLGVSDVSDDAIARRTSRRARRATGDGVDDDDESRRDATRRDDDDARRRR